MNFKKILKLKFIARIFKDLLIFWKKNYNYNFIYKIISISNTCCNLWFINNYMVYTVFVGNQLIELYNFFN